jgi:hypothetical protein
MKFTAAIMGSTKRVRGKRSSNGNRRRFRTVSFEKKALMESSVLLIIKEASCNGQRMTNLRNYLMPLL